MHALMLDEQLLASVPAVLADLRVEASQLIAAISPKVAPGTDGHGAAGVGQDAGGAAAAAGAALPLLRRGNWEALQQLAPAIEAARTHLRVSKQHLDKTHVHRAAAAAAATAAAAAPEPGPAPAGAAGEAGAAGGRGTQADGARGARPRQQPQLGFAGDLVQMHEAVQHVVEQRKRWAAGKAKLLPLVKLGMRGGDGDGDGGGGGSGAHGAEGSLLQRGKVHVRPESLLASTLQASLSCTLRLGDKGSAARGPGIGAEGAGGDEGQEHRGASTQKTGAGGAEGRGGGRGAGADAGSARSCSRPSSTVRADSSRLPSASCAVAQRAPLGAAHGPPGRRGGSPKPEVQGEDERPGAGGGQEQQQRLAPAVDAAQEWLAAAARPRETRSRPDSSPQGARAAGSAGSAGPCASAQADAGEDDAAGPWRDSWAGAGVGGLAPGFLQEAVWGTPKSYRSSLDDGFDWLQAEHGPDEAAEDGSLVGPGRAAEHGPGAEQSERDEALIGTSTRSSCEEGRLWSKAPGCRKDQARSKRSSGGQEHRPMIPATRPDAEQTRAAPSPPPVAKAQKRLEASPRRPGTQGGSRPGTQGSVSVPPSPPSILELQRRVISEEDRTGIVSPRRFSARARGEVLPDDDGRFRRGRGGPREGVRWEDGGNGAGEACPARSKIRVFSGKGGVCSEGILVLDGGAGGARRRGVAYGQSHPSRGGEAAAAAAHGGGGVRAGSGAQVGKTAKVFAQEKERVGRDWNAATTLHAALGGAGGSDGSQDGNRAQLQKPASQKPAPHLPPPLHAGPDMDHMDPGPHAPSTALPLLPRRACGSAAGGIGMPMSARGAARKEMLGALTARGKQGSLSARGPRPGPDGAHKDAAAALRGWVVNAERPVWGSRGRVRVAEQHRRQVSMPPSHTRSADVEGAMQGLDAPQYKAEGGGKARDGDGHKEMLSRRPQGLVSARGAARGCPALKEAQAPPERVHALTRRISGSLMTAKHVNACMQGCEVEIAPPARRRAIRARSGRRSMQPLCPNANASDTAWMPAAAAHAEELLSPSKKPRHSWVQ